MGALRTPGGGRNAALRRNPLAATPRPGGPSASPDRIRRDVGRRDDRGSSALELSIVAPALLFLIFFMIQAALWLYGRNVALQAAREGVSQLRLVQPTENIAAANRSAQDRTARFARQVGGETLIGTTATSAYNTDGSGRVSVTVEGRTISLLPGVSLHVTQTASGEIEQFDPDLRIR
ncbi:MAG: TadE/TadG family type IV pilus assembly protein [Frankia sp.]